MPNGGRASQGMCHWLAGLPHNDADEGQPKEMDWGQIVDEERTQARARSDWLRIVKRCS